MMISTIEAHPHPHHAGAGEGAARAAAGCRGSTRRWRCAPARPTCGAPWTARQTIVVVSRAATNHRGRARPVSMGTKHRHGDGTRRARQTRVRARARRPTTSVVGSNHTSPAGMNNSHKTTGSMITRLATWMKGLASNGATRRRLPRTSQTTKTSRIIDNSQNNLTGWVAGSIKTVRMSSPAQTSTIHAIPARARAYYTTMVASVS